MFAENVFLRDWEISAKGKSEVLAANQKIFDSVESICVSPIEMYEQGDTVVAELEILVDGKIIELVVDIIEFNESGKITSIKAYKGNLF